MSSWKRARKAMAPVAEEAGVEDMQKMNARVDIDGEKAEDVARDFLIEAGLIKE